MYVIVGSFVILTPNILFSFVFLSTKKMQCANRVDLDQTAAEEQTGLSLNC